MLGMVLTALEDCRNGTTDSFPPLNISREDAPMIVQQIFPMDNETNMHNSSHDHNFNLTEVVQDSTVLEGCALEDEEMRHPKDNKTHSHHLDSTKSRHNKTKLEGHGFEDAEFGRKRVARDRSEEGTSVSGLATVLLVAGLIGLAYGIT